MKIQQVYCPSCGGGIKGDVLNRETVFCPYCGQQLYIDHEKKEITINKNINKNINKTNRIINEAEIIRAKKEGSKEKYETIQLIAILAVFLFIMLFCAFMMLIS